MMMFLKCVGQAVVAHGLKALMGLVPMGDKVYDIAKDAIDRYAKAKKEEQLAADAEEMLKANMDQIRQEARQIAREVAAGHSDDEITQLEAYLTQVPSVARQSLKRPADPSGTTIPNTLDLRDPLQLATLLPRQPPRFRADDAVPHAPQWRFVALLGDGGFGEVWLARHSFLDQVRAFKFCLDPQARERLLRHELEVVKRVMKESKTLQSDQHGIVPLLDAYLDGDAPWLAYQYIDGGDLSGQVREMANLDPVKRGKQAVQILRCLAQVVGRFHRLPDPITHRDLKPANILVQRSGDKRLLRVTDFGISHIAADSALRHASVSTPSLSLSATFRGAHTPIYASPQQKRGLKADVRDDVHALGIIGYQLLLADLGAERPAGKWRKRVAGCQLPDTLLDVLESCWDDDPDERPRDAAALLEALRIDPPRKQDPPPLPPLPKPERAAPKVGDVITNALGMKFAWVPPGQSWLGGGGGNAGLTEFTLEQGLWCGVYPVTQSEWQALMVRNPSDFSGRVRNPVECVSGNYVQAFLDKLNAKLRTKGLTYRLPTEEEWEYICRGGSISIEQSKYHYYFAKSKTDLTFTPTNNLSPKQANFAGSDGTTEVGMYLPNPLGIYDLHGNVWEWTSSFNEGGSNRVIRGGSWCFRDHYCAASSRRAVEPTLQVNYLGFRVLAVPVGPSNQPRSGA